MDKDILNQYIDACELVKETEGDIRKLRKKRKTMVQAVVKGSMHEFPYVEKNHHVEGLLYSVIEDPARLKEEEKLLVQRKAIAQDIKAKAEAFVNQAPVRIQRIIRLAIFQKLTWEEVALKVGRGATAESVRKEFERFMKKNKVCP